jgi:acetylornithine deacetylase/succinyl-diaminopimelate desuccinylase-like protein
MSEASNPTAQLIDLTVRVQQIAAPTGEEERRAAWVARYLRELGIGEVESDSFRNVYARIPGRQRRPALMVSAHTDTVFPMEVDLAHHRPGHWRQLGGRGRVALVGRTVAPGCAAAGRHLVGGQHG